MSTAQETITVTVTGANPATYTYPVSVNIQLGTAPNLSIVLPGTHAGTDTVVAAMTSHSPVYTSNTADIAWQAVNGNIAVGPVSITGYNNSSGPGYTGFGTSQGTITGNSLVFNQVLQNTPLNNYCEPNNVSSCGGGYKKIPMDALQQQAAGGTWASNISVPGSGSGSTGNKFVMDATGYLIVNVPGTYTLYMTFANVSTPAFYIGGGATVTATGNTNGGANPFPGSGPNTTFWNAQTPPTSALAMVSNENPGLYGGTVSAYIKFPAAGKYPFELYYNQYNPCQFGGDNNSYVQIIYGPNGGTIYANTEGNGPSGSFPTFNPVTSLVAVPPTGSAPTGVLQLTPNGGAPNLQLQGNPSNYALTLKIGPGVVYTVYPYVPLLEGVSGHLNITNNGSTFAFQTFNGNAITGNATRMAAAAADGVVALSGNNTSWQGRLSVTADATANFFDLTYGGQGFDSGVALTDLTITADDIAWFFATNSSFDLFSPTAGGGGISLGIEVDYMVNPGLNSPPLTISPTSGVLASGVAQTFTITLSKPFSGQQRGTVNSIGNSINAPSIAASGGVTVGTATPTTNGAGFLTGWTFPVTIPKSTTNGSFTLTTTVTGILTYLNGNHFTVGGAVTYVNAYVATITTVGVQFVNPVAYSFSTVPASGDVTGSITLNATVYTYDNNPVTLKFYRQPSGGGTATLLVAGTAGSVTTGTVGGKTVYYHPFTGTATIGSGLGSILLGYTAIDTVSTLSLTWYSSTVYTTTPVIPPGGGGGGGCFTALVAVQTPAGLAEFGDLPVGRPFEIANETGTHLAELVVHENYYGWMVQIGEGERFVTEDHAMKAGTEWLRADAKYAALPRFWFEGTVYNMHVLSDDPADHHYVLFNGDVAHNIKLP